MGRPHFFATEIDVSEAPDGKPKPSSAGHRRAGSKGNARGGNKRTGGDTNNGGKRTAQTGGQSGARRGGSRSTRRGSQGARHQGTGGSVEKLPAKRKLPAAAAGLPRHVVEALQRVTPPARQSAALAALAEAAEAFSEGQFHVAARKADHAKGLSSRDATIREILGLASYRVGDWQTALRELRTYRRLSGETTHMAIEMDVLRALGRSRDVSAVWEEFNRLGGAPAAMKEARVVYASHLIDEGNLAGAADVIGRPRMISEPWPEDLRMWFVAARIAALLGNHTRARELADAIVVQDPSFPGLDELERVIHAT